MKVDKVVNNINKLLQKARKKKIEIIFVKSIASRKYLYENIWRRLKKQKRVGFLLENKWGSELYKINTETKDKIVKKIGYSSFSNNDKFKDSILLEQYLKKKQVKEVILVGFFADVCINLTAKDAFEKGFYITIVKDCTLSLENNLNKVLKFMKKYYNVKIISLRDI